jgi:hypothetical protein
MLYNEKEPYTGNDIVMNNELRVLLQERVI